MLSDLLSVKETSEDLAYGQGAIITARWILVVSALLLALWNPAHIEDLRIQIVVILGLAVVNFFLHAQVLMRKPVNPPVAYAASAADIVVISTLLMSQGGFSSHLFVFYFPALLAISIAFHPVVTASFTAAAVLTYAGISLATLTVGDEVAVVTRLFMMASVAACGGIYWQIEQRRRKSPHTREGELEASELSAVEVG